MVNHETKCTCNPVNLRPCLNGCNYLVRRPVILGIGKDDYITGEEVTKTYSGFYCELKDIYVLHPKIEHKNKFIKSEVTYDKNYNEISQESMPLDCNKYKNQFEF